MILRLEDNATPPGPPRAGLKLWLRADAGVTKAGGTVSEWADQSGNGNDVSTTGTQPAFSASSINGKPGISFSGAEVLTRASSPLVSGGSPRSIFIITKSLDSLGGCMTCIGKDGGWFGPSAYTFTDSGMAALLGNAGFSTFTSTSTSIYAEIPISVEVAWPGTGSISYSINSNPLVITGADGSDDSNDFLSIGDYWNAGPGAIPYKGDICEVLVFDHVVAGAELIAVRLYLQTKYAISLTETPVLALGDSITDGVGSSDGAGYRKPLTMGIASLRTYGPNPNFMGGSPVAKYYRHAGYDGYTSAQIARLTGAAVGGDPPLGDLFNDFSYCNVVTLHIGTNDAGGAQNPTFDPNYTIDNVLTIIDNFFSRRPASGVPLYFFVMLTLKGGTASSNDNLNNYVTSLRPLLASALSGTPNVYVVQPPTIPDVDFSGGAFGIHPLDSGYALMANDGAGHGWVPAMISAGLS